MEADQFIVKAPALPGLVLYGTTAALAALLIVALWKTRSWSGRFVIFAVWVRYILSAYHHITYQKIFAGLSGNALGSVAVVGLGLLTVNKRRHLLQPFFIPCYLMMAVILISGAVNGNLGGVITAVTKYAYFLVVAVALYEALAKDGRGHVLPLMLASFAPLIVLQAVSLVLGVAKPGDADGNPSYIGGFNHEGAFSIAVATGLMIICFAKGLGNMVRYGLVLICLAGIYIANYRTTILGIAPLIFAYFGLPSLSRFYNDHKAALRFGAVLVGMVGLAAGVYFLRERFADLAVIWADPGDLLGPPNTFTAAQRDLLSGRIYLWSAYVHAYLDLNDLQHVVGAGPESWGPVNTGGYPHNTLVSYLYEYGWVGVLVVLYFWGSMVWYATRIEGDQRVNVIAAHISFFVLNMATMPLWQIEGNIFYGLLCGYTLYQVRQTEARQRLAEAARKPVGPRLAPRAAEAARNALSGHSS